MGDFNQRYLEFCEPFIDAIKETYALVLKTEIEAAAPHVKKGCVAAGDCLAVIELHGVCRRGEARKNFQGGVVLNWSLRPYLKTVTLMLGEEHGELSEGIQGVGLEIGNMAMGNADSRLKQRGYQVESLRSSLEGGELEFQRGATTIVTPFKGSVGEFLVELSYSDADSTRAP